MTSSSHFSSSTLFPVVSSSEDVRHLFQPSSLENDNLFSAINIRAITNEITSVPFDLRPRVEDVPQSSLFGAFSEDYHPPLSPISSVMSLPDEVTQHTNPDDDDLWREAESFPLSSKKVDTWETFGVGRENTADISVNPFVTEQEPKLFDQLLRRHMDHIYSPGESGVVIDELIFREVPCPLS